MCENQGLCTRCVGQYQLNTVTNNCTIIKKQVIGQNQLNLDNFTIKALADTINIESFLSSPMSSCSSCDVCQYQTTFFCQKCDPCFRVCRCIQANAKSFKGFTVTCPNMIFHFGYIKSIQSLYANYKLTVVNSDPHILAIVPTQRAVNSIQF